MLMMMVMLMMGGGAWLEKRQEKDLHLGRRRGVSTTENLIASMEGDGQRVSADER